MGTILQKLQKLKSTKEAIRQAIIIKGQELDTSVPFSSYPTKIQAITTGIDTSDATATADNIITGKTAYANGKKITGTIPVKTASDVAFANGTGTITVPRGFYNGASRKVTASTHSKPTISIATTTGLVTSKHTLSAGYYKSGTTSDTLQLSVLKAKTYTPTTSNQEISSRQYITGSQTILGDPNLIAKNIVSGVSIFGIEGSAAAMDKVSILVTGYRTNRGSVTVIRRKSDGTVATTGSADGSYVSYGPFLLIGHGNYQNPTYTTSVLPSGKFIHTYNQAGNYKSILFVYPDPGVTDITITVEM